ncbi:MAG: hypothetical protein WC421_10980 [Elusimicrobiales bacterium]
MIAKNACFICLDGMAALVKLELRKHKMLFWGLASVYALAPLAAVAAGKISPKEYGDLPAAVSLFLFAVGVPFAAFVFGGAIGAATRREWRESEGLPVSAEKRVFGAFAAAGILQMLLLLVVVGLCAAAWFLSEGGSIGASDHSHDMADTENMVETLLFFRQTFIAGFMLLASAFLSGWLATGAVAAAALALILNAGTIAAVGFSMAAMLYDWSYSSYAWIWAVAGSFAGSVSGIWYFARVMGRSVGFSPARIAVAVLVLLLPTLSGLLSLSAGVRAFENTVIPPSASVWENPYDGLPPQARELADGVPARTLAGGTLGGIYFLKPDGSRTLLVERRGRLLEARNGWGHITRYAFADDGTLWLLYSAGANTEIYGGRPDGKLKLIASLSGYYSYNYYLAKTATGMALVKAGVSKSSVKRAAGKARETSEDFSAVLPFDKPQWKRLDGWVGNRIIPQPRLDGRTCSVSGALPGGKSRTWRLNDGKPCGFFESAGFMRMENGWTFGIGLESRGGKPATALLREDGSSTMIWQGVKLLWGSERPGGGFSFTHKEADAYKRYSIAPDGVTNPPTDGGGIPLRVRAGQIWYFMNETDKQAAEFVKYDIAAGKNIFSIKMRKAPDFDAIRGSYRHFTLPCPSGIFEFLDGDVRFYDWEGRSRGI